MVLLFALLSMLFPQEEATIVYAGDAMQHKSQLDNAARPGGVYDYSETFAEIAPWVSAADYAVVNLETTLGAGRFTGFPMFCSPDAYAVALKDAGFDLFLNANNHTLDRRDAGLRRTVHVLDSLGVDHTGTYTDAASRKASMPFVRDINGFKVAFLNYTYGTNGIDIQDNAVVDYIDRRQMTADIRAARDAGAELVVVLPHWGIEYELTERAPQRELARFLLDNGADAVIGGHPHVIQPMHRTADGAVVYSMGNLVSGMRTTDTRGGAMVTMHIKRDDAGKAVIDDMRYRLVFTLPGQPGRRADRLIFVDPDTDIAARTGAMAGPCRAFVSNAVRTFDRHNTNVPRHIVQR